MKDSSCSRSRRILALIHGQHAVDREVPADIAQEVDVVERAPSHSALSTISASVAPLPKREEPSRTPASCRPCCRSISSIVQDAGASRPCRKDRRHASCRRPSARSGFPPGLLQPVQHHDRRRGCRRAATAPCSRSPRRPQPCPARELVEPGLVGALVNEPALGQDVEEGRI